MFLLNVTAEPVCKIANTIGIFDCEHGDSKITATLGVMTIAVALKVGSAFWRAHANAEQNILPPTSRRVTQSRQVIDPNAPDAEGKTPAYLAAREGDIEKLKTLHEANVDLSKPLETGPFKGETPASAAAYLGDVPTLRTLQRYGVDLSKPITSGGFEGYTPIVVAAKLSAVDAFKFLFNELEIDPNQAISFGPSRGWTLACLAVKGSSVGIIQFLAEAGADLAAPIIGGTDEGKTPGYFAAKIGHEGILKLLEEKGGKLTIPISSGEAKGEIPSVIAAKKMEKNTKIAIELAEDGNVQELKELKEELGVDLSRPLSFSDEHKGYTPLAAASKHHQSEVLAFFKECGINLPSPSSSGEE